MKFDYSFFEESIHRMRKLRAHSIGNGYLVDAPHQVFPDLELGMAPQILSEEPDGWIVLTKSYARKPGKGLLKVEEVMQNTLPNDFLEFHQLYDEALITTRTYPIHLWNEDRILEEIELSRDESPQPYRLVRFGNYWDTSDLYFALWNVDPVRGTWEVVVASLDERDQIIECSMPPEAILGRPFHTWLKDFIERDGVPDPFMTRFGTLDPA